MKTLIRQLLIIAMLPMCLLSQPALPTIATNHPVRPIYFAVADVDTNGLYSAWSNEIVWTNGSSTLTNLSWDAPLYPFDHYVLFWGFQSRTYIFSRNLTTATNQPWPLPVPPPVWQKTFSFLTTTNILGQWSTNTIILCTVTGAPAGYASFDRAGQIQWKRIQ